MISLTRQLKLLQPFLCRLSSTTTTSTSRIARLESRLPTFLHRFTTPLRNAPVSHITAFLILHELTAIIPLFGLAAFFHYTDYLPAHISEGKWVQDYIGRFAGFARRKGWINEDEEKDVGKDGVEGRWWEGGEPAKGADGSGVRIVAELATAYAITKVLLPVRIVGSVWMTPWFARWTVLPVGRLVERLVGKGGGRVGSGAAGTVWRGRRER